MDPELGQRRRLVFALVVTAALIPAYFLIGRAEDAGNGLAATSTPDTGTAAANLPNDDMMGTIPLGYLTGQSEDTGAARPTIVIPSRPEGISTKATFLTSLKNATACLVPGAPADATVTVVNTDTGRGVECRNSIDPAPYAERANPEYAILPLKAYEKIADLTDAPVPVEVTW